MPKIEDVYNSTIDRNKPYVPNFIISEDLIPPTVPTLYLNYSQKLTKNRFGEIVPPSVLAITTHSHVGEQGKAIELFPHSIWNHVLGIANVGSNNEPNQPPFWHANTVAGKMFERHFPNAPTPKTYLHTLAEGLTAADRNRPYNSALLKGMFQAGLAFALAHAKIHIEEDGKSPWIARRLLLLLSLTSSIIGASSMIAGGAPLDQSLGIPASIAFLINAGFYPYASAVDDEFNARMKEFDKGLEIIKGGGIRVI